MRIVFLLAVLISWGFSYSQESLPYVIGEYSKFTISFGPVNVGHAEMKILNKSSLDKKNTLHIIGEGRTSPFFDWFFKVRDFYETIIDTSSLLPLRFNRDVNEGGHIIKQEYNFFHKENIVKTQDDSIFNIPNNTQDMFSALFYARTFKKTELKKTKNFFIPIFMDNENYFLNIEYLNNEILTTKWGNIDCMVFKPKMQEGRVFEDGEKMKIWISDDDNHLLMKVETEIWAGTIKAILSDCSGLKHPFLNLTKKQGE